MYEADQGHVEICFKAVGLEESSRPVNTPVDRAVKDSRNRSAIVNAEADNVLLAPSAATSYRAIVARMKFRTG